MAVGLTPLTLYDIEKTANDPMVRKIAFSMLKAGSLRSRIPTFYKRSFVDNGVRVTDAMPSWSGSKLNSSPDLVKTNPRWYTEQLWMTRKAVQIDALVTEEQNQIGDPLDFQVKGATRAYTYWDNDRFINNKHTGTGADADWIVGIRERIDRSATDNPYGVDAECRMDAGGTDLTSAAMTAATFGAFCAQLTDLKERCDAESGEGMFILGKSLRLRINEAAARFSGQGGFSQAKDQLGRTVTEFDGSPLIYAGRKAPTTTAGATTQAQIMTGTETAAGADGSSTFASVYFVKEGEESFFAWSFYGLKVFPQEQLSGERIKQVTLESTLGLKQPHTRAIARMFNIKVA